MLMLTFKMVLMNWMLALVKVRNPRRAGGVAAWSTVADIWLHISALLCFADLCGSLLFMACDICFFFSLLSFVFKFSRHLVYHVDSMGFISHISFYAQQSGRYVAFTCDYGFVCWILNWLVYWVNPSTAPTTISFPPSLVQQIPVVAAVKASLTAEKEADQPPAPSTLGELLSVHLLCRLRYSYIFFSFVCRMTHTNAQNCYWMLIKMQKS